MFVEQSRIAASMLRDNADRLEAEAAEVLALDAYSFTARPNSNERMDIVFLDPPFADDRYEELCRLLDEGGWLAPGALVYLEQDRKQSIPALPAGWRVRKEKTAGNVRYSLIEATT